MSVTDDMTAAAERTWLDTWPAGPTEPEGSGLPAGAPERAAAYHHEHGLPCPLLCDPDLMAYRAYGVGQWPVELSHLYQYCEDFPDARVLTTAALLS